MAHNTLPVNPDPEDLRKDLLAALAAGRELGPEMDAAIVDAHLRRHYGDSAAKPKAPAVVERQPLNLSPLVMPLTMLIGLVAFVAILYFSGGELWFLVFPLLGWWGWGRRGRWSHRRDRWDGPRDGDGYSLERGGYDASRAGRHEIV